MRLLHPTFKVCHVTPSLHTLLPKSLDFLFYVSSFEDFFRSLGLTRMHQRSFHLLPGCPPPGPTRPLPHDLHFGNWLPGCQEGKAEKHSGQNWTPPFSLLAVLKGGRGFQVKFSDLSPPELSDVFVLSFNHVNHCPSEIPDLFRKQGPFSNEGRGETFFCAIGGGMGKGRGKLQIGKLNSLEKTAKKVSPEDRWCPKLSPMGLIFGYFKNNRIWE